MWLVDPLTDLNRLREMGFMGTAPRGLLYLFGERYAWARPPRLISADPGPSRNLYNESSKMIQTRRDARSVAVGLDITQSATSSSTSNYCLKTWPPRLGRVPF